MIKVSYPGKLYVIGEYSIMEPGNTAVLVPVNRRMTGAIKPSDSRYIKTSFGDMTGYDLDGSIVKLPHVHYAHNSAMELVDHLGMTRRKFNLELISELESKNDKKYGFGSSGVVIITVLDTILRYHGIDLSKLELFKLAVYTQKRMGSLSSGGDLACAIFDTPISYTRYTPTSIGDFVDCIFESWDLLKITPLNLGYDIAIGWTKTPQSTELSLLGINSKVKEDPEGYALLCEEAQQYVKTFIDDTEQRLSMIDAYRLWMKKLEIWGSIVIETPTLTKLIEVANDLGLHAKVSGAGGGDCGIALYQDESVLDELYHQWELNGIEPIVETEG